MHAKVNYLWINRSNHGNCAPCLPVTAEHVPVHSDPIHPTQFLSRAKGLGKFHEASRLKEAFP